MGRLEDKTILITGAAHGIGQAVARCAADEGAYVIVTDVDDEAGRCFVGELVSQGQAGEFHILDVRKAEDWSRVVDAVVSKRHCINGLVNNAGVNVKYEPLEMPDEEWDRCFEINLRGAWRGARAVLPSMLEHKGGSIVNIASVHGHQIIPRSFPYPVAKHGLIGLTRALGVEYADAGVRVNAISPGYIETRLCQDHWASFPDPDSARRQTEALIPAGRIGQPQDIGMAAVFLLSDEASYITAAALQIDGGRLSLFHE